MLKLIIADDERIIRETICTIIDWKKYDIEITGLCCNGLEAYDMILDESPDIVLTDIRMPGMSGLELIEKIHETTLPTQFIILSGYGEFEYAKKAMSYGVKHYILKPCNEKQIIDSIIHCKKDCYDAQLNQKMQASHFAIQSNMSQNVMSSIVNDRICQCLSYDEIFHYYAPFIDFTFTPYKLITVYYLEFKNLEEFLRQLKVYMKHHYPQLIVYGIYVTNTLLLFFQDIADDYSNLTDAISKIQLTDLSVGLECQSYAFSNLGELIQVVLKKVKRFSMIYYINNYHAIYNCNYNNIISDIETLFDSIQNGDKNAIQSLTELLSSITDIHFFKQLASNVLLKVSSMQSSFSTFRITELLINIEDQADINTLHALVNSKLHELLENQTKDSQYSPMTQQIIDYIETHLKDTNLTLKYIAENQLYMNVDYVSKKFYKETGNKFSQFLTMTRIEKSKELIAKQPDCSIQSIAEQVGCSNNPQYFSKLFKKQTGITPSEYITRHNTEHNL